MLKDTSKQFVVALHGSQNWASGSRNVIDAHAQPG